MSWGVSIPTRSCGSCDAGWPPNAAAIRSSSPPPRCGDDVKAGSRDEIWSTVEHEHSMACSGAPDRAKGVGECRGGQRGRLRRGVRRAEASLHPAGDWRFREHEGTHVERPSCGKYLAHVTDGAHSSANGAGDLRLADPLPIADIDLGHAPARQQPPAAPSQAGIRTGDRRGRARAVAHVGQHASGRGRAAANPYAPGSAAPAAHSQAERVAARRGDFRQHVDRARCRLPPSVTGSATDGNCRGSSDASASMKHTTADVAYSKPA